MSENTENTKHENKEEDTGADKSVELQKVIDDLTNQNKSMADKMNELLGEKKRETEKARTAREEVQKKLESNGDFEQLYKSAIDENGLLKAENTGLKSGIELSKVKGVANKLANTLAGDSAPVILPHIISRLKYNGDSVKVLDKEGNLTINSTEDLLNEFKTNPAFSTVLKGNQSTGGGANGSRNSGGAADKTMTRSEFDQLDAVRRAKFMKDGGALTE